MKPYILCAMGAILFIWHSSLVHASQLRAAYIKQHNLETIDLLASLRPTDAPKQIVVTTARESFPEPEVAVATPVSSPRSINSDGPLRITSSDVATRVAQAVTQTWGTDQVAAAMTLVSMESGFNPYAVNPTSGACGIYQAYPCNKLPSLNIDSQIAWGTSYIKDRYGTPANALAFHYANGYY